MGVTSDPSNEFFFTSMGSTRETGSRDTVTLSKNGIKNNYGDDEHKLVQTDFGTPPKNFVNSWFAGRKFLYIFEEVLTIHVCGWIKSSRRSIAEDYVTNMTRFSMYDTVGSLPASSAFYRYIESHDRRSDASDRTMLLKYNLAYIAYYEPDSLLNKMNAVRKEFPGVHILVAEVLSANTLLKKISTVGPMIQTSVSATRLDPIQMGFVDPRLLSSLEKFVCEYRTNSDKVNQLKAFRLQFTCKSMPILVPNVQSELYTAQTWTTTCLEHAIRTEILRYRNIGLVGLPGSGKSYIINSIINANDDNILCIIPDVLEKRIVSTVESHHKLIIFDGITVPQLRQIPGALDNLLLHYRYYPVRRESNRLEKIDTTSLCSITAFETDNVSELLASTFFHKCGTIIAFSPLKINDNGNLRPLEDDDEDWRQFTRTRIYVPHTLVPGRVEDLLPENKSK